MPHRRSRMIAPTRASSASTCQQPTTAVNMPTIGQAQATTGRCVRGVRRLIELLMRPMTDELIEAAARSNPDSQPLTPADFARMKRTPQVKIIRRALGLSQDDFAARYHIPIGTPRDWE